jgi:HAAS domain-containing protein
MAKTHYLIADHPQPGRDQVEEWLGEVSRRLVGSARIRAETIAELRDGLLEAVAAHRAHAASPHQAATAALNEFGSPAEVAAAFAPELAARQARQTALALAGTGPLVGSLWAIAVGSSHLLTRPVQPEPPWMWPGLPGGLRIVATLLGAALAVGIPAGLLAIALTGRLSTRLNIRPRFAPTLAATFGLAGIAADVILLVALGGVAMTAPGRLAWVPLTVAALASAIRLTLNAPATRRLLITRVALA